MEEDQNIHCYKNRNDIEYYQHLIAAFDTDRLMKTAYKIEKEDKIQKVIRIDFCGSAASSILQGSIYDAEQNKLYNAVQKLFKDIKSLKNDGYALRIRFLFVYPYSDFSFAQIEAEKSPYRTTIKEKRADDTALNLFSLTAQDFMGSVHYIKQKKSLHEIERLYNKFCINDASIDLLNVKFTCFPINMRLISVNNEYFIEPYLYAKQNRFAEQLIKAPILKIGSKATTNIEELEDHFRYLWTHPTTLVYEDATNYTFDSNGYLEGLTDIKEPQEISFDNKANKFKSIYASKVDENKIDKWKFRVEGMFRDMTRIVESSPESETVFIAFSFANGKRMADILKQFLLEDFSSGTLRVNVVDLNSAKKTLHVELIQKMDEATMAVILFTKDILEKDDANHYSRPNIYFEYGYLLSHIKKFGNPIERITLFSEKGLSAATDFQDVGRFEYSKNEILNYLVLVERILNVNKTLTLETAKKVLDKCIDRLQDYYNMGKLDEELSSKTFIDYKNEIKSTIMSIISRRFEHKKK